MHKNYRTGRSLTWQWLHSW